MTVHSISYATRYEPDLLRWARAYAARNGLTVRAVLNAALAEYAARRDQTGASPLPQLHFRRGHPSAPTIERQRALMRVDPRGRRSRSNWDSRARPSQAPTTAATGTCE